MTKWEKGGCVCVGGGGGGGGGLNRSTRREDGRSGAHRCE